MGYASMAACVRDLEAHGHLRRIAVEVDPRLEAAEIQRRTYEARGPALLFERVKGTRFPMVSNLFGSLDRVHFMFRDALEGVRRLIELRVDPTAGLRHPIRHAGAPLAALHMLPRRVGSGPVLAHETRVSDLPQLVSWPDDGGPFVTLPQVYTEDPEHPGPLRSNLGMYRIQLAGNEYASDAEVGLHYQLHRGIGVHHAAAIRRGEPLRVNVFVGGPPAMTLAAVMPLPEGLSELGFAGALSRRRVRLVHRAGELPVHADADFCIVGEVDTAAPLKPEGPFGDHLGYYSLAHPFPVLKVKRVLHRTGAIWPFTVVGRPPQEDTAFGEIIHELTGPLVPTVVPGIRAVHAVDAAGVHPLLLAIGSERYLPFQGRAAPREVLTQANAILGQGQMSLAKFLLIVAGEDAPELEVHDLAAFLRHLLERFDPTRDLHFQTRTTVDTLDYSGSGFNEGSKLVIAGVGPRRRELATVLPALPAEARLALPGIAAVKGPGYAADPAAAERFAAALPLDLPGVPLLVMVDDPEFAARNLRNFLWTTFTRSDPARDVHGAGSFVEHKHWGCRGPLVIDARIKPHHAPPLVEDPAVTRRVDALAAPGGPLHGLF
jgi:4-hydroxy-3-polyprenylbenzoate decarboxylase